MTEKKAPEAEKLVGRLFFSGEECERSNFVPVRLWKEMGVIERLHVDGRPVEEVIEEVLKERQRRQ